MPVVRPLSEILRDVVTVAGFVTLTPATAFGHREELNDLRTEVAAAIARPAPDGRVIDERAAMLITAALHIAGPEWKEPGWVQLAVFLLPAVREQWGRAVEQELRPSP
jgi:hypothetical protein